MTDQPPSQPPGQYPPPSRPPGLPDAAEQEQQIGKAEEWLSQHWAPPQSCPIDGSNSWNVGNVLELRPFSGGALIMGGGIGIFPVFPVTCTVCGYTVFFNAIIA